jgi:hypothetical protein
MTKNNGQSDRAKRRDEQPPTHLPPELNKAAVDQGKKVEAEVNPPEEPIQQMREGPRRRKRTTAG